MPRRTPNDQLVARWKRDVFTDAEKVDPDKEHNWESLSYGYFLALTRDPKRAKALANEVYMKSLI